MYTAIFALVAAVASIIYMMVFGSAATGGLMLIAGLVLGMIVDDVVLRRAARQATGVR